MPPKTSEKTAEKDKAEANKKETKNYSFLAKGRLSARSFTYNKAVFENLSALYNVSDSLYIADQIRIDGFKGRSNSSVKIQMLPDDRMKINFKNNTSQIDINQVLKDFDDFKAYGNKEYISSSQLSGMFSTGDLKGQVLFNKGDSSKVSASNVHGQMLFIGDSLAIDKMKFTASLRLENGRLKGYPVAVKMGKDYNIDGLDDVKFKTLDTKLFITKGAVFVPSTNIKTNTFDVSFLGKQEFNMDCEYHLRFYLMEILNKGKSSRIKRVQKHKEDKDGDVEGLTSVFAIYKVQDGKVVKSTRESRDSKSRKKMKRVVMVKEATAKLEFHPLIVKYDTDVKESVENGE